MKKNIKMVTASLLLSVTYVIADNTAISVLDAQVNPHSEEMVKEVNTKVSPEVSMKSNTQDMTKTKVMQGSEKDLKKQIETKLTDKEAREAKRDGKSAKREAKREGKSAKREAKREAKSAKRAAEREAGEAKRKAKSVKRAAKREAKREKREAKREGKAAKRAAKREKREAKREGRTVKEQAKLSKNLPLAPVSDTKIELSEKAPIDKTVEINVIKPSQFKK